MSGQEGETFTYFNSSNDSPTSKVHELLANLLRDVMKQKDFLELPYDSKIDWKKIIKYKVRVNFWYAYFFRFLKVG